MNTEAATAESQALALEIARLEWVVIREISHDENWLGARAESVIRWTLSLARLTVVVDVKDRSRQVVLGASLDALRKKVVSILREFVNSDEVFNKAGLAASQENLSRLALKTQKKLLGEHANLSSANLNQAIQCRPLAIALSGGGGCGYVFFGALALLDDEGLIPAALAGNSIGAIVGAQRALTPLLELDRIRKFIASPRPLKPLFRTNHQVNRFTLPGAIDTDLHILMGKEFMIGDRVKHISELHLPFRSVVAGLGEITKPEKTLFQTFRASILSGKANLPRILNSLVTLAQHRPQAIYLGADEFTRQLDVLDAVGFSASIPGLTRHDIFRDDPAMADKVQQLLKIHQVNLLIDGGFVDNLPSKQAGLAIQQSRDPGRDPFILALDCFAPNFRHVLFLPLMQFMAEKSRLGYLESHCVISYRQVLAPTSIFPSPADFETAIAAGKRETKAYIPALKRMLSPITNPYAVKIRSTSAF